MYIYIYIYMCTQTYNNNTKRQIINLGQAASGPASRGREKGTVNPKP